LDREQEGPADRGIHGEAFPAPPQPENGRVGRNAAFSFLGFGIPAVATLLFTPFLLHRMGASNYGLWVLSTAFLGLGGVFDLGLSTTTARYIARHHARGDTLALSATVTAGVTLYAVIGLVLTVVAFMLAPQVAALLDGAGAPTDQLTRILRIAALGFVPMMIKNAAISVPIGLERFSRSMIISMLQTLLTFLLASIATGFGDSVGLVVASSIVALTITAVIGSVIAVGLLRPLGTTITWSRRQARRMLPFLAFTAAASLGVIAFSSIDRLVVGAVLGTSSVAFYAIAVGLAANLLTVADVISRPLMPSASAWASGGGLQQARTHLRSWTLGILALEACAALVALGGSDWFLTTWLGAGAAAQVVTPFRILVVVYATIGVFAPAYHVANGTGYPQLPAAGSLVGGTLTIALILALAPTWGLTGAALANAGYLVNVIILLGMLRILSRAVPAHRAPAPASVGLEPRALDAPPPRRA